MVRLNGVLKSDRTSHAGKERGEARLSRALPYRAACVRRVRGLALVLAIAAALVLLVDSNTALFADYADGVRTEQAMTLPEAVKVWRKEAWQRDDFLAQIRLGDLYSTAQSIGPGESKNAGFFDPVEAYVWYFLALRSGHDYRFEDNGNAYDTISNVRGNAQNNAEQLFSSLTFEQRLDARARILYILSSRGAEGFLTLGRIHASGWYGGGSTTPSNKPRVMLCVRSGWDHWYSGWLWWFWANLTARPYPHLPVWSWVLNVQDNWDRRLPDYQCNGADIPPEPFDNYALSNPSPSSGNGTITLSGNSTGGPSASNLMGSSGPVTQGGGSDAVGTVNVGSGGPPPPGDGSAYGSGGGYSAGGYAGGGYASGGYPGSGYASGGYAGSGYSGGYGFRAVSSVFEPNDGEALTYFQVAASLGHPLAGAYASNARKAIRYYNTDGGRIIAEAERRARYWIAPYEYYPGITAKGKLHSDESLPLLDERLALRRVRELPLPAILEALDFRGYGFRGRVCGPPPVCLRRAVEQFQAALDFEPTGFLSPEQTVRLIQMAAVDGDAIAQDRLGIMYAKGIGVPQNYVRAEKWFIKSANQRYPDALFNLYILYRVGPNGVEPDEAKAGSYAAQASAAGYLAARCELMDLLRQADAAGHDRPVGARR